MRFIGQYIQSFIARFRSDVYLEDIDTGTIASGGHLGLDSNNKIVKAVDGIPDGEDIAVDTDNFVITSATSQKPFLELKNTRNDNKASVLQFTKDKGAAGADADTIGIIDFMGDDAAQTQTRFARITAQVSEADNTDEAGKLTLSVAESDGTTTSLTAGLVLQGEHATDGEVDVTIAAGAASTTTVAGGLIAKTLTVGTTAAIDNSGVWVGGVIPSAKLDADTAHLTTDQTFTGTKTFNETIVGSINGSSATVATIAGLAPNTATTQATQPAIESIGTDGDTLSILGDNLNITNTTANKPTVGLVNQADDATAPELIFQNQRVDSSIQAGEDNDYLGKIVFKGYDDQGTPGLQAYATITTQIHDATSGEESGILNIQVANHDGGVGSGLVLTGGSEDNEIDVTLGLGANSVVTIPGDIDLAGDIDVDGTLEVDAFKGTGATTITNILDEDAMGSDSATALATQQSIKAYVDAQKKIKDFTFSGYAEGNGSTYEMPVLAHGPRAPFEHNTSTGSDGQTAITVQNQVRTNAKVMTQGGDLKRWTGWATGEGTGAVNIALFKLTPADDSTSTVSPVLLKEIAFTASGNSRSFVIEETSFSVAVSARDLIFTGIKAVSAKDVYFTSTLEIEV